MATSVLELKTVTDIAAAWFGWDIDEPSPVVEEFRPFHRQFQILQSSILKNTSPPQNS